MPLPIAPPYLPMEALLVDKIPDGSNWQYEPKWDGFRALAFRQGKIVELQAKSGRSLTRYFPELVESFRQLDAQSFVVDGEIVVPIGGKFSFDALLQRIHPAASRIKKLAHETPCLFIVFDLLVDASGSALVERNLSQRRAALEQFIKKFAGDTPRIRLSPFTTDPREAKAWLGHVGANLDGIIAKRRDMAYRSGDRTGMQKIKNYRSADCVVGGFRYNEGKNVVGSLLLGLYDKKGLLHHVGFTSSIKATEKAALTEKLEGLVGQPGFTGNAPGGPSRWSSKRSSDWKPLKPKLVVEVCYDHFSGHRFRHGTTILRWRPDKAPTECTLAQIRQETVNLIGLLK